MVNLDILGSLASQLHKDFRDLFYLFLPVFFLIALVLAWFRSPAGGPDFIETLKRVFIASLLLAGFPEITDTILTITQGITNSIGKMEDLEAYIKMAGEKAATIPMSPYGAILAIDTFALSILSYSSYFIVYVARFFMMTVYHFVWMFLVITSPMLLLFHVFTSKITLGLFKSLIEVACWPIVWAIFSVMLKSISFGNSEAATNSYLTLTVLNFVIAIALILTPFAIKGLVGGTFAAAATSLAPLAVAAMRLAPAKAASLAKFAATGISTSRPARPPTRSQRSGPSFGKGLPESRSLSQLIGATESYPEECPWKRSESVASSSSPSNRTLEPPLSKVVPPPSNSSSPALPLSSNSKEAYRAYVEPGKKRIEADENLALKQLIGPHPRIKPQ